VTDLAGRVALVTGGASGLGRATCRVLADVGALVVAADVDIEGAAGTVSAIASSGGSAHALELDVTVPQDVERGIGELFASHGGSFDILVNVAGIDMPGYLHDLDFQEFRRVNAVNYEGPVLVMHHFVNGYRAVHVGGTAEIVNVISISAITVGSGALAYNSSKAALAQATRIAQRDTLEHRYPVRIQGVMPAAMDTPMLARWGVPRERMMDPAVVAREILHAIRRPPGVYAQNLIITPANEPDWPR
jgi:NAD(P)-dependent dehydrogenase (short-subunit alcohol dehydrogenase family)